MSLDLTKQRLLSARERAGRFADQNIFQWAMETVLLPAQTNIEESISFNAARALSLEKTGFLKLNLVWDLTDDKGAPIHFYLEFGTDPHTIEPKGKSSGGSDVLVWKGLSGGFVIGEKIYAARVEHPGSKKHVGLVQGIKDERMPMLQEKLIREVNNYLQVTKI